MDTVKVDKDPTGDEMREFIRREFSWAVDGDEDTFRFDMESAIYWFSSDYHGGQWSNLYSAHCTSEYHPGPSTMGSEPESIEAMMYEALEDEFAAFAKAANLAANKPD